jgi:23S rRNA G2069 N7-methylase RlmK/C1962 C5-methylase RlmI
MIDNMDSFNEKLKNGGFEKAETLTFLEGMTEFLASLSDALTVSYFSHARENLQEEL